jgi:hypothetical protein
MRTSDERPHTNPSIGFAAPRTETASRGARQKIISRTKGPNHQGSSTRGSLVAQDLITDNHAGLSDSCPRAYQLLEIHATELKNHPQEKASLGWFRRWNERGAAGKLSAERSKGSSPQDY